MWSSSVEQKLGNSGFTQHFLVSTLLEFRIVRTYISCCYCLCLCCSVEGPLKADHKDQFSVSLLQKVNTDYRDDGSYDYLLDPPTELLNGSVELYSMVLYQTLGVKCTLTRMSVNTSVEELYIGCEYTCMLCVHMLH